MKGSQGVQLALTGRGTHWQMGVTKLDFGPGITAAMRGNVKDKSWSNVGAAQGRLETRKRNRSNDLDLICVHLEGRRSIQRSYGRTSRVDSKSFIAGDDTILQAVSLSRKGRRSIQRSYGPLSP
jgi:hypothetical protein